MSLKDVFKKSFWKNRWNDTLAGFAAYGQAYCGLPPTQFPTEEKPAAEKAPDVKPAAPAPKPPGQ